VHQEGSALGLPDGVEPAGQGFIHEDVQGILWPPQLRREGKDFGAQIFTAVVVGCTRPPSPSCVFQMSIDNFNMHSSKFII